MTTLAADVAIIGAGLIGSWTALFLARRGARVVVLEQGAGRRPVLRCKLWQPPSAGPLSRPVSALATRPGAVGRPARPGRRGLRVRTHGPSLLCGYGAEAAALESYAAVSESHGIAIERLDGAALRRRFPFLSGSVVHATFSARDAVANPRLATPAAARVAAALGATVLEHCKVVALRAQAGRFVLRTGAGPTVEAGHVVNAAGAWAPAIARMAGEDAPVFAAGPPQFVTEPMPFLVGPSVQTVDGSVIVRQIRRGNVILAGYPRTAADILANRAPVPPAKTLAAMAGLARLVPALRHAAVIRVWSGIEGYLPDMLPVIGPSATTPGLLHAFGCCGHGFQIGPGVGLCLSEMILDGATPTPLAPFAITRFAAGVSISRKFEQEFDPA